MEGCPQYFFFLKKKSVFANIVDINYRHPGNYDRLPRIMKNRYTHKNCIYHGMVVLVI